MIDALEKRETDRKRGTIVRVELRRRHNGAAIVHRTRKHMRVMSYETSLDLRENL